MGDVHSRPARLIQEKWEAVGGAKEVVATRACLPQVDPYVAERFEELKRINRQYEIDSYKGDLLREGLPAGVRGVPQYEKKEKLVGYQEKVMEMVSKYVGDVGEGRWGSFEELEEALFKPGKGKRGFPRVSTVDRWLDDVEFGRQRLTGAHPVVLTQVVKCELLPKKLLVTDEQVIGLITEDSVEEAVAARKLFIIDYHKLLDDIPTKKDACLCSPIALFYTRPNGALVPIAIQLYGGPTAQDLNPVYTPNDNIWAWRMAKMIFNNADMHYHLVASLLARCILAVNLAAIITSRCLSPHHPLKQLLEPFFNGCIAESDNILRTLVGSKSSPIPMILSCGHDGWYKIAKKSWAKFNFNNTSFKHDYTERVDPTSPLIGYYYREDGMKLWRILDKYVSDSAKKYYKKPDDIDDDHELKRWTREMVNNFTRFMELQTCRKEQPIVFNITTLIYMATGLKAGLTHNIYQQYAWVPNSPGVLSRGPIIEKTKDQITEKDLLSLLPDKKTTVLQTATAFVLSGMADLDAPHFAERDPSIPTYGDNVSTGVTTVPPTLPDPDGTPHGEPEVQSVEPEPPAPCHLEDTVVVDVYGIPGDHRQYTHIRGSSMDPSDAGDEVLETFIAGGKARGGLVEWEIRKAEGKIGNWVAPKGEFPSEGPAAAGKLVLQGSFWSRRLDVASLSFPPNTIFVRHRSGSTLLPAATSVGRSSYVDGYWEILHALTFTPDSEVVTPAWEVQLDDDANTNETQYVSPQELLEPLKDMARRLDMQNEGLAMKYYALHPKHLFKAGFL